MSRKIEEVKEGEIISTRVAPKNYHVYRKVLGICGQVVHLSKASTYTGAFCGNNQNKLRYDLTLSIQDLKNKGYVIYQKQKPKFTITKVSQMKTDKISEVFREIEKMNLNPTMMAEIKKEIIEKIKKMG